MKDSWVPIDNEKRAEWDDLCPVGEYRVIGANEVPTVLARGLVEKGHSYLVMASGSTTGTAYYMVNVNRIDDKANAIDQEPFGIAFVGNEPVYSGCYIHHGNWDGRTRPIPEGFVQGVLGSTLSTCYSVTSIPDEPAGKIEDLQIKSQRDAFLQLMKRLEPHTRDHDKK
jgi:hypothetical protein